MATRPIPINPAEAIFERFWDQPRSPLPAWRCDADHGTGGGVGQFWVGASLHWQRGGSAIVARMVRDVAWDITGYDRLMLCITLPATTTLDVDAVIDGTRRTLLAGAAGRSNFVEYEAAISGRTIEHLELRFHDAAAGPGQGRLMWIGVCDSGRREALRSAPSPYEHALDELIVAPSVAIDAAPTLGLVFDGGDLPALRRKAASAPYAPLVAQLRERARAAMGREPWRGIGRFPNEGGPRGARGGDAGHIDPLAMRLGALIGLIDNDPDLLRMALRHALAMAHCEHWVPDFLEAFPGSSFEQRAFFDYRFGTNVVYAWDWAGAYLTPAGKALLAHAVATKALPRIHMTLMRHRYIRGCNQGAYMAYGAIICQAALTKVWPHADDYLVPAHRALDETMNTYLADDGGAFEGMGYVSSTLGHALVAYHVLARLRKTTLREVTPVKVSRGADYLGVMLSTAPPIGSAVNVADGGRPGGTLYPECLPFLAQLLDVAAPERRQGNPMASLLAAMLDQPLKQESFATPGSAFVFLAGPPPESLPPAAARPPVFHVLPNTGQLCSCRATADGDVRLQVIGAPANAGHGHEDKGSFVLEAFGEEIAIDRGQMEYSDPRCGVIKAARYHNLLIPLNADGEPMPQLNPCHAAVLPTGQGDEQRLDASVEAGAAWGPRVRRWLRRFESTVPTAFIVVDEMDFEAKTPAEGHEGLSSGGPAPLAVGFYVHSRYPWTRDSVRGAWVTRGRRCELTVTPEWTPVGADAGEDFVDGARAPAFTLVLRTPAACSHRLRTLLTVRPAGSP